MNALLSHTTPTESKEQRAHLGQFGFDRRPRERNINCAVYPSLLKWGHFCPLLAFGESPCLVRCFLYPRVPSEHRQPAYRVVRPSPCGSSEPLMGAIRQELRLHSLTVVLTALHHAAHLTPPSEKISTCHTRSPTFPPQDLDKGSPLPDLGEIFKLQHYWVSSS